MSPDLLRKLAVSAAFALVGCGSSDVTTSSAPKTGVPLAGPGTYTLAGPSAAPIATLSLPAGTNSHAGELREASAPSLPPYLTLASPVVELAVDGHGLSSAGTLLLRSDAPAADNDALWALAIGEGGARRMSIAGFREQDGVTHAELTAVDAGRYVLVRAGVPEGCAERSVVADPDTTLTPGEVDGATRVRGNLRITDAASLQALRCLVQLDGDLAIDANAELHDLTALRALTLIGGNFAITHPSAFDAADLPSLFVADGDVALQRARNVSLPLLAYVGGGFGIGEGVQKLDAPALRVVAKSLGLVGSELPSLDGLPALTMVGGNLGIVQNHALGHADGLASLKLVGGSLLLAQNAQLESAGFPALDALGGLLGKDAKLMIADNPLLKQSPLDALAKLLGLAASE